MQLAVGNQMTTINSEVACLVQCLCVAQLGVNENEVEDLPNIYAI